MPGPSPSERFALWFTNLRQFQTATNDTTLKAMGLLPFANATILTYLTTVTAQKTFLVSAATSTGYDDMATADLTTYKTFEGLLDHWNPLVTSVFILLQPLADPSLQGASSADFMNATVAAAFPGGSAAGPWTTAMTALQSNIPAICFSGIFQKSINSTVDKSGSKMSGLISQIAVLG